MQSQRIHPSPLTRVRQLWFRTPAPIIWALLLCFQEHAIAAMPKPTRADNSQTLRKDPEWIQQVVNEFRARLKLANDIRVSLVARNALMVSVEPVRDDGDGFLLLVEEGFLDAVTEDELRAAVAHELGHVWIFTHHPYLQTEKLANQIAMRLVTRESLVSVYAKVWERQGTKGDLVRFVGD